MNTNSPTPTELTPAQHALGLLVEHFDNRHDYPEQTHGWLRDAAETASANWVAQSARIASLESALVKFCDADLGNLSERSACRRQAYDALGLLGGGE